MKMFKCSNFWFFIVLINFDCNVLFLDASSESVESPAVFEELMEKMDVRKCCPEKHYYNSETFECLPIENDDLFTNSLNHFLNYYNMSFSIISGRIEHCPETKEKPRITIIIDHTTHALLEGGEIYDNCSGTNFSHSHYCLEIVGNTISESSLVLAYCLGPQKIVPKCCPVGHFFDTRNLDCSRYFSETEVDENSVFENYLSKETILTYEKDLICNDVPVKIRLDEGRFNSNVLCLSKSNQCYTPEEYCIDNMLKEGEKELVQSAFVCPSNFLNKCCPVGKSLHEDGCVESEKQSLSLIHILNNSRYQTKSISHMGSECNPVTLEDNTKSDIKWFLNQQGYAVINKTNDSITTRNFCIDDFVDDDKVFPVIKVCSEEVGIYHEISSVKDWSKTALGKCCPKNLIYDSNSSGNYSQCVEKPTHFIENLEKEFLNEHNISQLLFSNLPDCAIKEYYHKYDLQPSYKDYAEITENRLLKIFSKENNCITKESVMEASKYCIDFVQREDGYKPIAITCATSRDLHKEKYGLIVTLVGISCAALISAFFSILFMRVRRGMVTVKKINTLAGRILTSYVLSQLVGYLVLGISMLADFKDQEVKCFVLAGFLMFFMISSFCWNTSICLEGLLLTMHIQLSEIHRFIYHSIWAWGLPGIITTAALVKDSKRDLLPCDAITPKFGVQRCFFSDPLAQIVYFHVPISITVIINAILLISAKILRKKKLKNLEKDPNRVRRHENLQQVLSIKSIRSRIRGEPSIKPLSNHSGLRTHHNRNLWIESLKLVLWSGTTWLMEIVGTFVPMYWGQSPGQWYFYLWYLPVGFNCLRGLGIFAIISLNAENKTALLRTARTIRTSVGTTLRRFVPSLRNRNSNDSNGSSVSHPRNLKTIRRNIAKSMKNKRASKQRSISVTTITTNLSSSTAGELNESQNLSTPNFYHSISQIDSKSLNYPELSDVFESFENDKNSDKTKEDVDFYDSNSVFNMYWDNEDRCNNLVSWAGDLERKSNDFLNYSYINDDNVINFHKNQDSETNGQENVKKEDLKNNVNNREKLFFEDFDYCTHL